LETRWNFMGNKSTGKECIERFNKQHVGELLQIVLTITIGRINLQFIINTLLVLKDSVPNTYNIMHTKNRNLTFK
jgi:hypothetical protein